jgi:hypothetical protein
MYAQDRPLISDSAPRRDPYINVAEDLESQIRSSLSHFRRFAGLSVRRDRLCGFQAVAARDQPHFPLQMATCCPASDHQGCSWMPVDSGTQARRSAPGMIVEPFENDGVEENLNPVGRVRRLDRDPGDAIRRAPSPTMGRRVSRAASADPRGWDPGSPCAHAPRLARGFARPRPAERTSRSTASRRRGTPRTP